MITYNDCLVILKNLFRMNQHRIDKCRVLFELAQKADGPIVELGSYHGMSTIALDMGSGKNQVYAVDDWSRVGWANERYKLSDYETFKNNLKYVDSQVVVEYNSIEFAAGLWRKEVQKEISLIFWDTGVKNCLLSHFYLWEVSLKKNGLFLVHDTDDCRLGWNDLRTLVRDEWQVEEFPPLHGLRRLV